jgi:hypothetical protein
MMREVDNRPGEAYALHDLGNAYRDRGRLEQARNCFDRCLPVFHQLGDSLGEAHALHSLGKSAWL